MSRVLVLSGGGSRGAWQVGALQALLESGKTWNSIHGISVGALNGAFLALFSPDEQAKNFNTLLSLWLSIKDSNDIYKPWSKIKIINYLYSMFKGALNSGLPLETIMNKTWDYETFMKSGVNLSVGCTSLKTGKYKSFDKTNKNIQRYILASSHLPLVFPPIEIDEEQWVDGGIRHQIPFVEALRENPEEIDVVLTAPLSINQRLLLKQNLQSTPRVALRASEIMADQVYANDYFSIVRALKAKKHKINIYAPKVQPNYDSMNFDQAVIKETIVKGYVETKELLLKRLEEDFEQELEISEEFFTDNF